MQSWSIIIVRCDGALSPTWQRVAQVCGARVISAASDDEAIESVERYSPDCAVAFCTPRLDPAILAVVERIRRIDHSCPVLVATPSFCAHTALEAMRSGVSDVLDRDMSAEAVAKSLERIGDRLSKHKRDPDELPISDGINPFVGRSTVISRIRDDIRHIAQSDSNILITGESGTGKELVAELIHRNSRRSRSPFVAVNCAAIPDTLLESELFGHERGAFTGAASTRDGKLRAAAAGTLFLDEIGDMSLSAQAKILRAIETRVIQRLGSNVDNRLLFRVIAATNQDLESLTREKKFRNDLYYRLNVVRIELPPLREHAEDIPELTRHLIRQLSQRRPELYLEDDVIRRLQQHNWPGNVRELRNVLESILVYTSSRSIGLPDIPPHIRKKLASTSASNSDERVRILSALSSAAWNRDEASKILRCSRMTLYRKMIRYSISQTSN